MKILGCLLVFSAMSVSGFVVAGFYTKQVRQLDAMIRLISSIDAQIEYCLAPLSKIFDEYVDKDLWKFINEIKTFGVAKAFDNFRKECFLDDADISTLTTFFGELGTRSSGEEHSSCEYTLKTLNASLEAKKKELPKKIKIWRSFGIIIGITMIILLI